MRMYETVTIFRPDLPEEQVNELLSRIEGEVEAGGGKVTEINQWGIRKLAYSIKRQSRGNYTFFKYAAPSGVVRNLEYLLRVTEGVIRFLTIKMEEEVDERELASIEKVHKKEEVAEVEEKESAYEEEASGEAGEDVSGEVAELPTEDKLAGEDSGGEESRDASGGSDEKPEDTGPEEGDAESEKKEEPE